MRAVEQQGGKTNQNGGRKTDRGQTDPVCGTIYKNKNLQGVKNMKLHGLYAVRDVLAKEFGVPFSAKNDEVATRNVTRELMKAQLFNSADFELWKIGEYDIETGIVTDSSRLKNYVIPISIKKPEARNV